MINQKYAYIHALINDSDISTKTSGVVFYVDLYEKIYVKITYTILYSFKYPTWIPCEFNFMCKIYLYEIYINFLY
jgi:hypothetical protein